LAQHLSFLRRQESRGCRGRWQQQAVIPEEAVIPAKAGIPQHTKFLLPLEREREYRYYSVATSGTLRGATGDKESSISNKNGF
jgi:hypothetical protein